MTTTAWIGLLGVAVVLAVTPGPDTLLALRYAVVGRHHGVWAASGTSVAIFAWAAVAAVGVAAVLNSSPTAYAVLAGLGGAYLLVLGLRTISVARGRLRAGSRETAVVSDRGDDGSVALGTAITGAAAASAFLAGVVTCLTNPKTGLFFIALFPQFVTADVSALYVTGVLGGTVAVVIFAYLVGLVAVADAARRWLARPLVTAGVESVSGVILAGLGMYMAVEAAGGLLAEEVGRWMS